MPYISSPSSTRLATITFGLSDSELPSHLHPSDFLTYTPEKGEVFRPRKDVQVQLNDLRPELVEDAAGAGAGAAVGSVGVLEQVERRGFGIAKHRSDKLSGIGEKEGAKEYLDETCELMRSYLGCSRVIQWNSTVRRADEGRPYIAVERQNGPEKDFVPTSIVQPVAGHAHVDQDETWAPNVVKMATGEDANTFKRSMIINIWRPLRGPVTNSPLCMLDFTTLSLPIDISKQETMFGTALQVHHNPAQKWYYLKHQMSDEIVILCCYDSFQGNDGRALYVGHVAAKIDDSEGVDKELVHPRESIEVRMVAVWE
ncbi:hypothetical protein CI109_105444 [Kwoniella shandongensis]|uniref:Uncharacterized protein n=1 Tax=Kwoniella shandongensis TaxID=1734106 RepID=A0A5M6C2M0_9TREE|nr:uncharacterized protein CI109_002165 [Kwoniella shandongensis]KAA5529274.1 hypothetical protein CI109_002165 [Kwoniella shandongensis]